MITGGGGRRNLSLKVGRRGVFALFFQRNSLKKIIEWLDEKQGTLGSCFFFV